MKARFSKTMPGWDSGANGHLARLGSRIRLAGILRTLTACALILAHPATAWAAAFGQMFEAEGIVEFQNYLRASEKRSDPPLRFVMTVSNECWFARLAPAVPTAFDYQEAAYDGVNLYHLVRLHFDSGQSSRNVATARLFDNQQVVYDLLGHPMGPLWLMLASSDTFRTCTNNMVPPVVTLGLYEIEMYHQRPFKQKAYWSLQQGYPHLPLSAVYLDDGETKTDPQFQPVRRKAPFDRGFTNIIYKVTALTNVSGFTVPWSADLDTYRPDLAGKPQLLHYTNYRIRLTRWALRSEPILFRPKLPGPTVISDGRVFDNAGIHTYLETNDWPTLESVTNAAGFAEKVRLTRQSRAGWSGNPDQRRVRFVRLAGGDGHYIKCYPEYCRRHLRPE